MTQPSSSAVGKGLEREALKKRITAWLFSSKWTDTHTEFDEVEALTDMVESELRAAQPALLETLDALYKDSHHWSTRPCGTCAAISKAVGFPFGCDRKAGREALIHGGEEGPR